MEWLWALNIENLDLCRKINFRLCLIYYGCELEVTFCYWEEGGVWEFGSGSGGVGFEVVSMAKISPERKEIRLAMVDGGKWLMAR